MTGSVDVPLFFQGKKAVLLHQMGLRAVPERVLRAGAQVYELDLSSNDISELPLWMSELGGLRTLIADKGVDSGRYARAAENGYKISLSLSGETLTELLEAKRRARSALAMLISTAGHLPPRCTIHTAGVQCCGPTYRQAQTMLEQTGRRAPPADEGTLDACRRAARFYLLQGCAWWR